MEGKDKRFMRIGITPRRNSKKTKKALSGFLVRAEGLEPPCFAAPDPKSGMSTNSTTPALFINRYWLKVNCKNT